LENTGSLPDNFKGKMTESLTCTEQQVWELN